MSLWNFLSNTSPWVSRLERLRIMRSWPRFYMPHDHKASQKTWSLRLFSQDRYSIMLLVLICSKKSIANLWCFYEKKKTILLGNQKSQQFKTDMPKKKDFLKEPHCCNKILTCNFWFRTLLIYCSHFWIKGIYQNVNYCSQPVVNVVL